MDQETTGKQFYLSFHSLHYYTRLHDLSHVYLVVCTFLYRWISLYGIKLTPTDVNKWLNSLFCLTHYQTTKNLDWSKLKQFADDNFIFDENSRKFSRRVETLWVKEKLLVMSKCFQKACLPGASKGVIVWEWVHFLSDDKILDQSNLKAFIDKKSNVTEKLKFILGRVENIVRKG